MRPLFRVCGMLVALSLILAVFQPLWAAEHLAVIGGSQESTGATVSIFLNEKLEKMAELFKGYEKFLKGKGIDAQFLLGAGDLRRAILHQNVDAPGDVEIFVHVPQFKAEPFRLGVFLKLLHSSGVALEGDLRKIYGPKQKLDIFFRDRRFFKSGVSGKPFEPSDDPTYQVAYVGEIGLFEGMGDNTLNALKYWPSENRILGSRENIAALQAKVVHNLEFEKTRRLDAPGELPRHRPKQKKGSPRLPGPPTYYPEAIVRMALRSLRAVLDTEVAPNPNQIRAGEDLLEVAHGVERYFEFMPDEHFSAFKLDEYQAEQFFKLFRNRSEAELVRVRAILERSFPGTIAIWKKLGIDFEVLTKLPASKSEQRDLENLSLRGNPAFREISQIMDPTGHIGNPFKTAESIRSFMEPHRLAKLKKTEFKIPPQRVWMRLSPSLVSWVQHFDQLNLHDQNWVVKEYIELHNLLSGDVYERIVSQKTFDNKYGDRFSEISPAALNGIEKKSGVTLGEFLDQQIEASQGRKRITGALTEESINGAAVRALMEKIEGVIAQGGRPILALDLDDVAFLMRDRNLRLLKSYDQTYGTDYFKSLKAAPGHKIDEFLYAFLSPAILDFVQLREAVENIVDYVSDYRFNQETLRQDVANPVIVALLADLQKKFDGKLRFAYVSARKIYQTDVTRQSIEGSGLPIDALALIGRKKIMGEPNQKIAEEKTEALRRIEVDLNGTVVGLLEDNVKNLNEFESEFPEGVPVRVFHVPMKRSSKMFLAAPDQKITPLFYGSIGFCPTVLKTEPAKGP